jgi:hypothetical protein
LGFAEWSPVGGPDEQQCQSVRSAQALEVLAPAGLIDGIELRNALPNGGAGLHVLVGLRDWAETYSIVARVQRQADYGNETC